MRGEVPGVVELLGAFERELGGRQTRRGALDRRRGLRAAGDGVGVVEAHEQRARRDLVALADEDLLHDGHHPRRDPRGVDRLDPRRVLVELGCPLAPHDGRAPGEVGRRDRDPGGRDVDEVVLGAPEEPLEAQEDEDERDEQPAVEGEGGGTTEVGRGHRTVGARGGGGGSRTRAEARSGGGGAGGGLAQHAV